MKKRPTPLFNIDPPVACNCHWDNGHESHCAIVRAHDARLLKNNVDKSAASDETAATNVMSKPTPDIDKLIEQIKDARLILRTGKDVQGNSYNDLGKMNQGCWIGEHVGPLLLEIERLRKENAVYREGLKTISVKLSVLEKQLGEMHEGLAGGRG